MWGAWHLPLIVSGQYAAGPYPILSAVCFMLSIVAGGYVAARARLESGSVWPAVVLHSSWNSNIQGFFDGVTAGGNASRTTSIWIGESGILVVAASILVTLIIAHGAWTMRRFPKDQPVVVPRP